MVSEKFKRDLEKGLQFEERVLEKLTSEGWGIIKNPDVKWMDFILVSDWAECKFDVSAHKWWNAYIEYSAYGKPSWIFKEEKLNLKWWIHSTDENEFYLFHWKEFRRFIADRISDCEANTSLTSKGFRLTTGWDWKMTKGLLVPLAELEKQAYKTYVL